MSLPNDYTNAQHEALKNEVVKLFRAIQEIKIELASIKHPHSKVDHFDSVADQLNEIASETENASHQIIEANEAITDLTEKMKTSIKYKGALPVFEQLSNHTNAIFEACAFHDITGQRISRAIKMVNLIEGTLNSLVAVVGKDSISALPMSEKLAEKNTEEALAGPALKGKGVSQEDIDKIF